MYRITYRRFDRSVRVATRRTLEVDTRAELVERIEHALEYRPLDPREHMLEDILEEAATAHRAIWRLEPYGEWEGAYLSFEEVAG